MTEKRFTITVVVRPDGWCALLPWGETVEDRDPFHMWRKVAWRLVKRCAFFRSAKASRLTAAQGGRDDTATIR